MGKGLGLNTNSQGVHLAFAAGTGVLVFVDIVARMLMGNMGIIPESECFHKDFKFHFYASFMSREESVALALLEALEKVQKKKGLEQYKLILRLSKGAPTKPPRWDRKYLESELTNCKKQAKINKVWACGPPLLDEQFDKILLEVSETYDIDFKTQVDIM